MALTKNSKSLHVSHNWLFCMLIRVYDVTYVEIQCNHSKLRKFVKNGQKHFIGGFFSSIKLAKIAKKTRRKCFVDSRI